METPVYVDILLVLNYVINSLLLVCTAKIAGRSPKRRRIVAAALLGSVGSLTIFLPFPGFFFTTLEKLMLSLGMVLLAFGYIQLRELLKNWFLFFFVSFLFAGSMLGIWLFFSPRGMLFRGGVVYFDLSFSMLMLTTAACYLIFWLHGRLRASWTMRQNLYDVRVFLSGKYADLNGLVDSGNRLTEPLSGAPVLVCGAKCLAPLFPPEFLSRFCRPFPDTGMLAESEVPIRLIPYGAVGKEGMLPAFRPDCVLLHHGQEKYRVEDVYIAIAPDTIGDRTYNALLSPDLIGIKLTGGAKQ